MDAPRTKAVLAQDSLFQPDPVLPPELSFNGYALVLSYPTFDETAHVRVSFEGLDSFRWARGEFDPYEAEGAVAVVERSAWLRERHAYEAEYYGAAYEWGRGADTMLTDTHHYLFRFHDEFVEVLARGLWFERSEVPLGAQAPPTPSHPANPLGPESSIDAGTHAGIRYEVRANPRSRAQLLEDARLHSQRLFELLIDGDAQPSQLVRLRTSLEGREVRAWVEGFLGVESATFDHPPAVEEVMPLFHAWIAEVADRRG
jgi:hypothetical protein